MDRLGEFIINHWVLVSALVIILVLLIINEAKQRLLGFQDLKPVDAVQLINREDAVPVDVRDDQEFARGHIANAVHAPLGVLESRLEALEPYRDRPLIVYCRTGQQAAKAANTLYQHGFTQVYKLRGGVSAWQSAELPLIQGESTQDAA